MISDNDNWPVHKSNEAVSILAEEEGSCHRFLYRGDGTISVCFDPELLESAEVPAYVKEAAKVPGGTLIPRVDRKVLRSLLDQADALEASKPS